MGLFRPCLGKTACVDDIDHCRTCGRTHSEIRGGRQLIDDLANFALEQGYENFAEFFAYVARKAESKLRHQRETEV